MVKNKLLCFWGNIMPFVLTSCMVFATYYLIHGVFYFGECLEPETTGLASSIALIVTTFLILFRVLFDIRLGIK